MRIFMRKNQRKWNFARGSVRLTENLHIQSAEEDKVISTTPKKNKKPQNKQPTNQQQQKTYIYTHTYIHTYIKFWK